MCYEYTHIKYDIKGSIDVPTPKQGKHININSDGFRGKEINFQINDYKIFFLGGSTAFGHVSSNDSQTIPALLDKKFTNEDLNIKVINAGIPGADSMDERYYIEKYITKYSPNMIILYDGWNDAGKYNYKFSYEEFKNQSWYVNYPPLESNDDDIIPKTGITTFFRQIDYKTGQGVAQALHDLIHEQNTIPEDVVNEEHLSKIENRLQNNWSEVCKMGEENNFQIINILQPILGTSNRTFHDSENFLNTEIELNLISFRLTEKQYHPCDNIYDFRTVFEDMNNVAIYFDQGHVTDFGNQIIAEKIYEKILPIVIEDTQK
jgi:lysophospholipase L1-like esterase